MREQPGEPLAHTLAAYLRARHLLLVLDNCEHLIDRLRDPLCRPYAIQSPARPSWRPARKPLRIAGEIAWPVPPLTVPTLPDAAAPALEQLLACEAVRLFVERARLSRLALP